MDARKFSQDEALRLADGAVTPVTTPVTTDPERIAAHAVEMRDGTFRLSSGKLMTQDPGKVAAYMSEMANGTYRSDGVPLDFRPR